MVKLCMFLRHESLPLHSQVYITSPLLSLFAPIVYEPRELFEPVMVCAFSDSSSLHVLFS